MEVRKIKQAIEAGGEGKNVVISRPSGKTQGELVGIGTDGKVKVRINDRLVRVYPGQVYGFVAELHTNVLAATLGEGALPGGGLSGNTPGNWGRRKGF
jgi:hypothetical protein